MSKSRRGRRQGSRDKIVNEAKQAILMAFDRLGGVDRLVAWAKEDKANEALFWTKIFTKLLPRPAIDAAPPPDPAVVKGAFTWRTAEWAKKVEKAQLRNGMARVGDGHVGTSGRAGDPGGPPGHEDP